jgi:membrane protein implicated in regulation of membrane protease activity
MKAFWLYTLARFAVLAATYLVIWGLAAIWLDPGFANLFVLLVAFVISSVISYFALARMRDDLAIHLSERAGRISQRIEESRRAEDVD